MHESVSNRDYSGIKNSLFNNRKKKGIHFKRAEEKPFLKRELSNTTLLFGGLTTKHEIFLKASFENLGYVCDILPNPDFEALQLGKEFCDPGLCNPVYFTFGALLKQLRNIESSGISKEEIISKYVFFTAGSCGPCRFGMYESQFRIGLKNSGFDGFRVLVFQQNEGLDQLNNESALEFNHDFFLRILISFVLADIINDVAYQYRPFEKEKGSVEKLLEEILLEGYSVIKKLRYPKLIYLIDKLLKRGAFSKNLLLAGKIIFFKQSRELKKIISSFKNRLADLEFDFNQLKPIVKITGEFWAQTTEGDGNLNMHRYLENNGAQVIPEQLSNWILYLIHQTKLNTELNIERLSYQTKIKPSANSGLWNEKKNLILLKIAEKFFTNFYDGFRKILDNIPYPLVSQEKLRIYSEKYFNPLIEGGEGHLEIGKTLYYTKSKQCHMVISVKPFGCMPSSMSDGIMSAVISHNPEILFSSIETGGEGIVNMYSRVLMTLNEAKELAKNEMDLIKQNTNELKEVRGLKSFVSFSKDDDYGSAISTAAKYFVMRKK